MGPCQHLGYYGKLTDTGLGGSGTAGSGLTSESEDALYKEVSEGSCKLVRAVTY